jgi:hypothetical protein
MKKKQNKKKSEEERPAHLGHARDPIQPSKARARRSPLSKPKRYVSLSLSPMDGAHMSA